MKQRLAWADLAQHIVVQTTATGAVHLGTPTWPQVAAFSAGIIAAGEHVRRLGQIITVTLTTQIACYRVRAEDEQCGVVYAEWIEARKVDGI